MQFNQNSHFKNINQYKIKGKYYMDLQIKLLNSREK